MRVANAVRWAGTAVGAALLLAGCGGVDGEWEAASEENPIEVLTIDGSEVQTRGEMSCPGSITASDGGPATIELDCDDAALQVVGAEMRQKGTVEVDGLTLTISWEGMGWGGYIDSFR